MLEVLTMCNKNKSGKTWFTVFCFSFLISQHGAASRVSAAHEELVTPCKHQHIAYKLQMSSNSWVLVCNIVFHSWVHVSLKCLSEYLNIGVSALQSCLFFSFPTFLTTKGDVWSTEWQEYSTLGSCLFFCC